MNIGHNLDKTQKLDSVILMSSLPTQDILWFYDLLHITAHQKGVKRTYLWTRYYRAKPQAPTGTTHPSRLTPCSNQHQGLKHWGEALWSSCQDAVRRQQIPSRSRSASPPWAARPRPGPTQPRTRPHAALREPLPAPVRLTSPPSSPSARLQKKASTLESSPSIALRPTATAITTITTGTGTATPPPPPQRPPAPSPHDASQSRRWFAVTWDSRCRVSAGREAPGQPVAPFCGGRCRRGGG